MVDRGLLATFPLPQDLKKRIPTFLFSSFHAYRHSTRPSRPSTFSVFYCAIMHIQAASISFRQDLPAKELLSHGGIRTAPSRRITSPLSIWFDNIDRTSCPYSSGSPSRLGKGIDAPSSCWTLAGSASRSGVKNRPGAYWSQNSCVNPGNILKGIL